MNSIHPTSTNRTVNHPTSISENIDTAIELRYMTMEDYADLKEIMNEAYGILEESYWEKHEFRKLLKKFPEGQVGIEVNGSIVGVALSIIVNYADIDTQHNYEQITGNYTFSTHNPDGDVLYGIDVFIKKDYRGMRLGRRLYDYRKEYCERHNLRGIVFGGRIPNYHQFAHELSPRQYIQKVKLKEIHDPVLNFQLSNDFHVKRILKNYLPGDAESADYAALLQWDNIYYTKAQKTPQTSKTVVRLGLVQWQMRAYRGLNDLLEQMEFFVDAVSSYRSDFVLFPEFFNAPLMRDYNHLSEPDSIRELARYTEQIRDAFVGLAIKYNVNIITGSMPLVEHEKLYNVGYLCKRNGECERYVKIHVTPDEGKVWGMVGGEELRVFDTDCGKVGILICYDVEFPELGRLLADRGMNILFVPFLTDTQNGYSRVRNCAQARAIENECYVAIAGSIGNLPKVHNMDIQFAQSVVFTPCDFQFPNNGIKAEATPNTEMVLISDVDIDLLKELHQFGSVQNLRDRRKSLYQKLARQKER